LLRKKPGFPLQSLVPPSDSSGMVNAKAYTIPPPESLARPAGFLDIEQTLKSLFNIWKTSARARDWRDAKQPQRSALGP
jgi:hypothetical protein